MFFSLGLPFVHAQAAHAAASGDSVSCYSYQDLFWQLNRSSPISSSTQTYSGWGDFGHLPKPPCAVAGLGPLAPDGRVHFTWSLPTTTTPAAPNNNCLASIGDTGTLTVNRFSATSVSVSALNDVFSIRGVLSDGRGTTYAFAASWTFRYAGSLTCSSLTSSDYLNSGSFHAAEVTPNAANIEFAPPLIEAPSATCSTGQRIVDGTVGGLYRRLYVLQPDTNTVWICLRVENASDHRGFGLRVVVDGSGDSGVNPGPTPGPPDSGTCPTTGNEAPGPHPLADDKVLNYEYHIDVYAAAGQVMACLSVQGAQEREVVSRPAPVVGLPSTPRFDLDDGSV
jgi:hypothetical protein